MGLVTVLQNRLGIILRYLILILLKLEEGLFSKVCSFLVIFYLYWALLALFFQLPAPWYSGREAGLLRDPEVVTFLWPGLLLNNNLSYIHPNDSAPRLGLQHVASMPAHKGADYGHSMLKWMKFGEESRRKIAHSGYEPMTSLLVALDLFICELLCWPNGRKADDFVTFIYFHFLTLTIKIGLLPAHSKRMRTGLWNNKAYPRSRGQQRAKNRCC